MDIYKFISIGSPILMGIIAFVLKKMFESTLNKKLEIHVHSGKMFIEVQIKIYQELDEISYKIRNYARDYIDSEYLSNENLDNLRTACHDFENFLYMAKINLEDSLFDQIHKYKVINKKLFLNLDDSPELHDTKIKELYRQSEKLYNKIHSSLKRKMDLLKEQAGFKSK